MMSRVLKYFFLTILSIVLLLIVFIFSIYIPFIQNLIKSKALSYVKSEMGIDIRYSRFDIKFPLDIDIEDLYAVEEKGDTLLALQSFYLDISLKDILKKQVYLPSITLDKAKVNLGDYIPSMRLDGEIGKFAVIDTRFDISNMKAGIKAISLLDSDVEMSLVSSTDTVAEESSKPIDFIATLDSLVVKNSAYSLDMPDTDLNLKVSLGDAVVRDASMSLADNLYKVGSLRIDSSAYNMNLDTLPRNTKGFDPMHIALSDVVIEADSIVNQVMKTSLNIRQVSLREQSGFRVKQLSLNYDMDSLGLEAKNLKLLTPTSIIEGEAAMSMNFFDSISSGDINIDLTARIQKRDIEYFINPYLPEYKESFPNEPLVADIDIKGSNAHLNINKLDLELPEMLRIAGSGYLSNALHVQKANGEVKLNAQLENLDFINAFMPSSASGMINMPKSMAMNLDLTAKDGHYTVNSDLIKKEVILKLLAEYELKSTKYLVDLSTDGLNIEEIVPMVAVKRLDAKVYAEGIGTDIFKPDFKTKVDLDIPLLVYDSLRIDSLSIKTSVSKNLYDLTLNSLDPKLKMNLEANGMLKQDSITAKIKADMSNVDLMLLGLVQSDMRLVTGLDLSFETNLKQDYAADLTISDLTVEQGDLSSSLGSVQLAAEVSTKDAAVVLKNGDLKYTAEVHNGFDSIMVYSSRFSDILKLQLDNFDFDYQAISDNLPDFDMELNCRDANALYAILQHSGYGFGDLSLRVSNSPESNLSMNANVENLMIDTTSIQRIDFDMSQTGDKLNYLLKANKKSSNPNTAFDVSMLGYAKGPELVSQLNFIDGYKRELLDIGLLAGVTKEEISLFFTSLDPIILYQKLKINKNNFIKYNYHEKFMGANFEMTGKNDFLIAINADTVSSTDTTKLNANIKNLNLGLISNALPDIPPFSGELNTDLSVFLYPEAMHAIGGLTLDSLTYNKRGLGSLQTTVDYSSAVSKGHDLKASMNIDAVEVINAALKYQPLLGDSLWADISLNNFPLKLADPFIPDAMASLQGEANAKIDIDGTIKEPSIEGSFAMSDASVYLRYANATYQFDDAPLILEDNKLVFKDYKILAYNSNPLVIDGDVDFNDFSNLQADLKITGTDVELLNVKKRSDQMVYGRLNLGVNTSVEGPLDRLKVRGSVDLLSGTSVNYILQDSPLTKKNRIDDLVAFTSFMDTSEYKLQTVQKPLTLSGIDILLTLDIAPTALFGIDLAPKGDDRVELIGGGNLAFKMSPRGDMDLSGRYNLTGGYVNYSLPVLPVAKKFNIRQGSYVEWTGNVMDPYISIEAYETIRSSVTEEGKGSRLVTFEPTISIKNKLESLNLSFDLIVPDDLTIQNQLAQMTPEERSRQAMNMIITQVYSGPGTTSKMNANSAINSFIQKEINQFAGSMLKGVDLSVGIDSYDDYGSDGGGSKRTDYSFRFSKSLFNDKFRIVIGASVSSGDEVSKEDQQNFIDDISLEYMLDRSGNRYIKLFHQTGFESVLEGDVVETGIGVVLKRKVDKLRKLFIIRDRKKKKQAVNEEDQN